MTANKKVASRDGRRGLQAPELGFEPEFSRLEQSRAGDAATREWIIDAQHPEGFWHGELEGTRSSNPSTSC